eukprot:scaffold34983_cov229-Amphora_coffeaeformis.AAC.4
MRRDANPNRIFVLLDSHHCSDTTKDLTILVSIPDVTTMVWGHSRPFPILRTNMKCTPCQQALLPLSDMVSRDEYLVIVVVVLAVGSSGMVLIPHRMVRVPIPYTSNTRNKIKNDVSKRRRQDRQK